MTLKICLPQLAPIWLDRDKTLEKVISTVKIAAKEGANLIVFGEAFVPGYPFWLDSMGGAEFNSPVQKEIFSYYSDQALTLEDGHLGALCAALKEAHMACYVGVIERPRDRSGHSLYLSLIHI